MKNGDLTGSSETPSYSNMQDWSAAIEQHLSTVGGHAVPSLAQLATEAAITKAECRDEFEATHLPTYVRYVTPLNDFLNQESVRTDDMTTPTLWFQLIPKTQSGRKQTVLNVTDEELLSRVDSLVPADERDNYIILVSEFLENRYGGQMLVTREGSVEIYFGEGNEMEYSSGEKKPTHTADNHTITGSFRYSPNNDEELRRAIWQVASAASISDEDGRFGMNFRPGYYEFALCGDELRPVFLDYRSSSPYLV